MGVRALVAAGTVVGVVVPAYNAEATIAETLRSVCVQSHRALEIIVVDDGSTDRTRAIAEAQAAVDPRITVIAQANAGVAAARNAGWRAVRADFLAFIDADDLWAETKIERQLEQMIAGGAQVGLVYGWSAQIDADSRITGWSARNMFAGNVLDRLLCENFIGNGSTALVRREALIAAGGFQTNLRDAGAQGSEDFLFYCRVAAGFDFAVVPDYLTGYRLTDGSMSSDRPQMLQSFLLAATELVQLPSVHADLLEQHFTAYVTFLIGDAIRRDSPRQIAPILATALRRRPSHGIVLMPMIARAMAGRFVRRVGKRFRSSAGEAVRAHFLAPNSAVREPARQQAVTVDDAAALRGGPVHSSGVAQWSEGDSSPAFLPAL